MLSEETLDTRLTAECITTLIYIIACFLHSGSEIFIVVSLVCLTRFCIDGGSKSTKIFLLDGAALAWTTPYVTDCCDEDSVYLECQRDMTARQGSRTSQGNRQSR